MKRIVTIGAGFAGLAAANRTPENGLLTSERGH
jgi:NADH dehydrogenase FAD-containing subunit